MTDWVITGQACKELCETLRAALVISEEEREGLRMLKVMLREDADVHVRYGWQKRYRDAAELVDRLLSAGKETL